VVALTVQIILPILFIPVKTGRYKETAMITCPWCGTHYTAFQSNCNNCGGTLPLPAAEPPPTMEQAQMAAPPEIAMPPAPPRQVPKNYLTRLIWTDAGFITGFVFTLLGGIFTLVGLPMLVLSVLVVPMLIGLPFTAIGLLMLAGGIGLLAWRSNEAKKIIALLENGQVTRGQILEVTQNFNVRVNHRYPWTIRYGYQVNGNQHQGQISTFSMPGVAYQPNTPVPVLYAADAPSSSTLYPNALGYFD